MGHCDYKVTKYFINMNYKCIIFYGYPSFRTHKDKSRKVIRPSAQVNASGWWKQPCQPSPSAKSVNTFRISTRSDGLFSLLWHFGPQKAEKRLILNCR